MNAVDPKMVAFGMMIHVMNALQSVMLVGGHQYVYRKVASGTILVYCASNFMPICLAFGTSFLKN